MTKYVYEDIDYSSLVLARDKFEEFRKHLTTEQEKAGAIQAFEYCYELAWKTMKRVLEKKGLDVKSPRDTFRQVGQIKLIYDPEIWFEFIKKRNLTVHTYDKEYADEVIEIFDTFSDELNKFINVLSNDPS